MTGRQILALAAIAAVAGVLMAGLISADAHPGHIQKKLFMGRWYQPAAMDLSTSQINNAGTLQCDGAAAACAPKWVGPIQSAVDDWNSQQDTARFLVQPNQSLNYDINIWVEDEVFQPGVLGVALFYGSSGNSCNPDACTYYYGDAVMGDDSSAGAYGTYGSKQVTVAHELGHLLSLRHESVNESVDPSHLYPCGFDDTGPIPTSVMAYRCIDPPEVGGAGITQVQPFDVCGVNHAYPDGAFGWAGCPATPTPVPTPSPTPVPASAGAWGNVDCGGGIGAVDALKILRYGANLTVLYSEPCTHIGLQHPVASSYEQGDIDCSGGVNSVDALKLMRFAAALPVSQAPGCPTIGVDPP